MGAKSSKRRDPSIVTQTDDVRSLRFQYVKDNTRDIFNAIDSDKSGFLDKTEILAFYEKIGIGNKFAENDVEDIDEDSDGRLSFDEYFLSILKTVFHFVGDYENEVEIIEYLNSIPVEEYEREISRLALKLTEALSDADVAAVAYEAEMRGLIHESITPPRSLLREEFFELFPAKFVSMETVVNKSFNFDGPCSSIRLRALYWRMLLEVVGKENELWAEQLEQQRIEYNTSKTIILRNVPFTTACDRIEKSMCDAEPGTIDDRSAIASKTETICATLDEVPFAEPSRTQTTRRGRIAAAPTITPQEAAKLDEDILKDLNRLFVTGIHEDYFKARERQNIVRSVLFVWSVENRDLSYCQGMHEIAGILLFCLEEELYAWSDALARCEVTSEDPLYPLAQSFSSTALEAYLYTLFSRVMEDMKELFCTSIRTYEAGASTPVVEFCRHLQHDILGAVDPELSDYLMECGIDAQLYGMRWTRLLFSRELPVAGDSCLRLWDYIFARAAEQADGGDSNGDGKGDVRVAAAAAAAVAVRAAEGGAEGASVSSSSIVDPPANSHSQSKSGEASELSVECGPTSILPTAPSSSSKKSTSISSLLLPPDLFTVEVFENERRHPITGFGPGNLFAHPHFSDASGVLDFQYTDLESAPPPAGCRWVGNWKLDRHHTKTDPQGWSYALSYDFLVSNCSRRNSHAKPNLMRNSRRRKWYRPAQGQPPPPPAPKTRRLSFKLSSIRSSKSKSVLGKNEGAAGEGARDVVGMKSSATALVSAADASSVGSRRSLEGSVAEPLSTLAWLDSRGAEVAGALATVGACAVDSPLLRGVGEVALALLLQIRSILLEGDGNTAMMAVMRYPTDAKEDVTGILRIAHRIRCWSTSPAASL